MSFEPIAVVGRACLLPGAHSPEELWRLVEGGSDLLTPAPEGRWLVPKEHMLCGPTEASADRTWSDRGGYVRGFGDVFDPEGFDVPAAELAGLDPVFLWTLHTARAALADAGQGADRARVGAIFGNLSFPSLGMARYAQSVWMRESEPVDPRNRFSSGLPAILLERALGLGRGAFALDAACASSLYAIKLACDRLADGDADLMLAGATNCADDLFIHVGFSALSALSRSGQSRPFHAGADGLVPAEGSAFVALKRLRDALAAGDRVLGVIRGVGLSNDGRGRGFLVPSTEGQVRALRAAYEMAGVDPATVSLLECHATGTPVGDAVEVDTLREVFGSASGDDFPLGSLKSNLGHLISAAGAAGLIKVLEALRTGVRPATLWTDAPLPQLEGSPFRLLRENEPWEPADGAPRRAGVSAFGFGGNNAHLVVEELRDAAGWMPAGVGDEPADGEPDEVAIVAVQVLAAECATETELLARLAQPKDPASETGSGSFRIDEVELDVARMGVPPHDLRRTLGQQLAMAKAGLAAADAVAPLPRESTGLFVGMGVDAEVARYGLRWRLGEILGGADDTARDGVVSTLEAAGVLGTMPNLPANRLNRMLDIGGRSCTVSCEEASGLEALRLAVRALRAGELDAALACAVDAACEPVHEEALRALGVEEPTADVAVALVLRRRRDAEALGEEILALVRSVGVGSDAPAPGEGSDLDVWSPGRGAATRMGRAHAASALLEVAAATLGLRYRVRPSAEPWLTAGRRAARVECRPVSSEVARHCVLDEGPGGGPSTIAPDQVRFWVVDGADRADVLRALDEGRFAANWRGRSSEGARLVLAGDPAALERMRGRARAHLESGAPAGAGVVFRERPVEGDLAFVYTSAGTAYPGMGRELLAAMPDLGDRLTQRIPGLLEAAEWMWSGEQDPTNSERLWGASVLSQLHTELSLGALGLRPRAAIGYSSGETNSLIAMGAWTDGDAMRTAIERLGLYEPELGAPFDAVARAWGEPTGTPTWAVWSVLAPLEAVQEALADLDRVHLAIVHTAADCVIAGCAQQCERAVQSLGAHRCQPLSYDIAAHVPEVEAFRDEWLEIHRRHVTPVPGVRFYSAGHDGAYEPETERCAQAILRQACSTLDFRAVIESAYADGARIFVEHGPMGACTNWIRENLGARTQDTVQVALDRRGGGAQALLEALGQLLAAGVAFDPAPVERGLAERGALVAALSPSRHPDADVEAPATLLRLPMHPPRIDIETLRAGGGPPDSMPPAPELPSVLDASKLPPVGDVEAWAPAPLPESVPAAEVPATVASAPAVAAVASAAPGLHQAVAEQLARMDAIHRQYLAQQIEMHQRFLALQMGQPVPSGLDPAPAAGALPLAQAPPVAEAPATTAPVPEPAAAGATESPAPPSQTSVPEVALDPGPEPPASAPESPSGSRLAPPRGLRLDRSQLEVHASGTISSIYGPVFAPQDGYARQVRMPEPPLLLADRVTGIDAEPGVHGTGVLWSETDVTESSWYLHRGRMPAGILIEAGQADLMLISYMGTDLLNQGERVYRLLGCQLTFLDDLPKPGDTLQYEIHVDGHAKQDEVRLFFFHYDCEVNGKPRIQVRGGQAGFFTDAELAASAGVLWSPEEAEIVAEPRLDPPAVLCERASFSARQVLAFAEGRPWECFGAGFEVTRTHTLSPTVQTGDMLFLDEVVEFSPGGGPWERGYLRAEAEIRPDDWFFEGHFKNDPCMPGTLMFEGCLQALAFYLAAMGFTVERDSWRFQPVKGEPVDMRCRGQVTPESKQVVYEVFVEEVIAGPVPTVYADLLCTVDGQKAFHARRAGLQLVPDWPLELEPARAEEERPARGDARAARVATEEGEFTFGYDSLLACAWGRPSQAFGPIYQRFDGPMPVPRLPGPPYHFLSRVTALEGPLGGMEVGSAVEVEYDVPPDAWYFDENGARTMPFAVLLEAALQPCGWLASYVGCALQSESELRFRNLDGTGTLHGEVFDDSGTLATRVELSNISQSGGMIIVNFDVHCRLEDRPVYDLKTVFGFFPPEALVTQVGLAIGDGERWLLEEPSDVHLDLRELPQLAYGGSARLGRSKLRMLDRITGRFDEPPECLREVSDLPCYRGERKVDPSDWYFKAHFFQDPVQPGSLGIEAMIQLLQFAMLDQGLAEGIENPRFECIATQAEHVWKYRGQVSPDRDRLAATLQLLEMGTDENGAFARCNASLWCDGIRIYSAEGLGMRIVPGEPPRTETHTECDTEPAPGAGAAPSVEVLDPGVDRWLLDHCPTWNRPALPMMVVVDRLARAALERGPEGSEVVAVRDVRIAGWIDFDGARQLTSDVRMRGDGQMLARLLGEPGDDGLPTELASARVELGSLPEPPQPWLACEGAELPLPYASGETFHGPAFQLMRRLVRSADGASSTLDAGAGSVPTSCLHPALLDAALHAIPHDQLHTWSEKISDRVVAYPARVVELALYGPTPEAGEVRCEVRFQGFLAEPDLPRFGLQLIATDGGRERVWAEMVLVESCFPKGPLGMAAAEQRRAFVRDREAVPGLALSEIGAGETRLERAVADASDWMPGTLMGIYGTRDVAEIARREHVGAKLGVHPGALTERQLADHPVTLEATPLEVRVRDAEGPPGREAAAAQFDPPFTRFDPTVCREPWARRLGVQGPWLGRDLVEGLLRRYVGSLRITDPAAFAALRGRGAVFVANHQVQIESILVTHILSALTEVPVTTVANAKHERRWIGWLLGRLFGYPGVESPGVIRYFDQSDPGSMLEILGSLAPAMERGERSFFAHTAGTRSQRAGDPVHRLSSVFVDIAVHHSLPMVPVRFVAGLPLDPIEGKLEFPYRHTSQLYFVGSPIQPERLAGLPYKERRDLVLTALNSTGPALDTDAPGAPDALFEQRVDAWRARTGAGEVEAVFFCILQEVPEPSEETARLLEAAASGTLVVGAGPHEEWLAGVAERLFGEHGPKVERNA